MKLKKYKINIDYESKLFSGVFVIALGIAFLLYKIGTNIKEKKAETYEVASVHLVDPHRLHWTEYPLVERIEAHVLGYTFFFIILAGYIIVRAVMLFSNNNLLPPEERDKYKDAM